LIGLQRQRKVTNNKTNTYLVVGMGAAGGILLGRFLPVLLANVNGIAQGAAGRDPFAGLIRQHRLLLSLLDKMERVPATNWAKRKFLFLAFKRTIGKHAMAEEDIIYPLLNTDADRHEATQKLYREHASMKIHLFELERRFIRTSNGGRACARYAAKLNRMPERKKRQSFHACGSCWTSGEPLN
jgi:hypothetical protein